MATNLQSIRLNARSTVRIHRAGMAAIAGAIALAITLLGHEVAYRMGVDGNIGVPGTFSDLVSYSSLTIAWGLLFLGSLGFTALMMRSNRTLSKIGAGGVSFALGLITLGFGFALVVSLVSPSEVIFVGDMLVGISSIMLLPLALLVLGVALLRTDIVSRRIAWLMAVTGPMMVLGVVVEAPLLGIVLFAGPLCIIWIAIGRDLIAKPARRQLH